MANAPSTSLARAPDPSAAALAASFSTSTHDVAAVTKMLERAAAQCHLVAASPACGSLPEGCEVAFSSVLVNVEAETYAIAGGDDGDGKSGAKRGIGKSALQRIASSAGVSWDPRLTRRIDDGRTRHYWAHVAVGRVRQFDGSELLIQGEKCLDARDGSPLVEGLIARFKAKHARWVRDGRKGYEPRPPDAQIRELRAFGNEHTATRAQLRAIRSLGIRTSYTAAELARPFVVARLIFTGRSDDPTLRRQFALMGAARFMDSTSRLYGDGPAPPVPALTPAPAVGAAFDPEDLPDEPEPAALDAARAPAQLAPVAPPPAPATDGPPAWDGQGPEPPSGAPTPSAGPLEPRGAQGAATAPSTPSGVTIPAGRSKGTPIESASVSDVVYWHNRIADELNEGKVEARFEARSRATLDALAAELRRRNVDPHAPEFAP